MSEAPFTIGEQMLVMASHEQAIRNRLGHMDHMRFEERFWKKDGRLWEKAEDDPAVTGTMGWINVAEIMRARIAELTAFAQEVSAAGFERAVLAGMGGSSLAPLVLSEMLGSDVYTLDTQTGTISFGDGAQGATSPTGSGIQQPYRGQQSGNPTPSAQGPRPLPVQVLDSTDPATVLRIQRAGPLDKTLFIIASKSGTTAEPTAYDEYFFDQISKIKPNPGENFVAITDPGTDLVKTAAQRNFRRTFLNFPDIGGRFSALTYFGLVPAALMGIDLEKLLGRAIEIIEQDRGKSLNESPSFVLGAALGTLATLGIDKCTFIMPAAYQSLGLWLEQLMAESTGKEGKGILPVAGEDPGSPSEYGEDRIFAYLRPVGEDCTYLDARIATLRDQGRPIVQIAINDKYDVAREFMRWELATAVAGSVIGINPFDQPNVQEAKDVTKKFVAQVEAQGALPKIEPDAVADGLQFYTSPVDSPTPNSQGSTPDSVLSPMTSHLAPLFSFLEQTKTGDFVTLMAYLTETPEMTAALTRLQCRIRDCTCLATTKGYGPRFLHSTGQFHKGGPNKGNFIQLTQDDKEDCPLPGRSYTFGTFRNAQALGDKATLEKHGRRVIRIHLGKDPLQGVQKLIEAVESKPTVVHA